jgi:glycosyltransferase involved in cell wall biosynthesis
MPNWEEILAHSTDLLYDMEKFIGRSSVVVWQRVSTYRGLATIMGMREKYKKKMILEVDDDVLNVDSSNPGFYNINPDSDAYKVFKAQIKDSDGVIVSTETLKKAYEHFNKKVFVVPNAIDFKMWKKELKRGRKAHDKLRIFFQGGMQHIADLQLLMPVVPKILKKYDVEFHLMGCNPSFFKIKGVVFHDAVPILDYPKKVIEINPDIIIAPLMDTHLNRARSNLRVLEAGVLGVSVVAQGSDKLPYFSIIASSGGGLLATGADQWVKCLGELIESEVLRVRLGSRLRDYVQKNYNAAIVAQDYKKILMGM